MTARRAAVLWPTCVCEACRGSNCSKHYRAAPSRPPTLMVTALADVPTAVRAMSLGAMTVLQKPYRDQELWDALGNALALSSHRRRDEAHVRERQARMALLTSGETQVLDLIMAGRPNKGIARELGVGLRTVGGGAAIR